MLPLEPSQSEISFQNIRPWKPCGIPSILPYINHLETSILRDDKSQNDSITYDSHNLKLFLTDNLPSSIFPCSSPTMPAIAVLVILIFEEIGLTERLICL